MIKGEFELLILLRLSPKPWDYRRALPHRGYALLGMDPCIARLGALPTEPHPQAKTVTVSDSNNKKLEASFVAPLPSWTGFCPSQPGL